MYVLMCSWKIHQLFSLPSTAMLPRHIINSAPRLHPSQLNYQQSVMHGNHRALRLLPWYNLPQPSWTNNSFIFPVVWNYFNLLQPQRPFTTPRFQLLNIPYSATYGNVRMSASLNMAHTSERDPKRRRSSSGSHPYSRSKAQKRQEIDSSKQESGESKMYGMRTSNRGFTQSDWPKTSAECDWRRGPRTYEYNHQSQVSSVQIPKRPNQFGSLRVTTNQDGSKSVSRTNSSVAEENTAPSYPCYTRSSTQSGLLSVPPQSLPLQPSRNLHSSEGSSQASQSGTDSKSTYRKRLWFNLPQHRGPQKKGSCVEFSVVSYNVLAQCLLDSNNHLYRHCDRDILLWDHRKRKLLDEIQQADADVICLQEVESQHFDNFFQPALQSQGYASMYKKRTGDKGDGCATFYKTSSFQEVSHTKLEYQRGIGLLDRDNVAIVVVLQPKGLSSSHQLCVANTHLLWNPRRGDIKLAQLGLLFAEIERLSNTKKSENTYHPVVLCGDFNSVPHCPLYKFVKKGQMRYEGMAGVDVSGQEPGRNRVFMSSPLWPKEIGVSSHCRYIDTYVRQQSSQNSVHTGGAPRRNRRKSRGSLEDNVVLSPPPDDIQGQLIHPFFFSSAYDHSYGNKEITTNHSRTNTTVDYIFYTKSVPSKTGSPDEPQGRSNFTGQLSLVKRLTLFTDSEVRAMGGLPNAHWPSDHLSLQATLRLTPND